MTLKNTKNTIKCTNCEKKIQGQPIINYLYNTPWDDKPKICHFCSLECEEAYMYPGDFNYFQCDGCNRWICEQNPANGYHVQFRYSFYDDITLCLKCYQEKLLKKGVDIRKIKDGKLPGLFFEEGILGENGFFPIREFNHYYVNNEEAADRLCKKIINLHDDHHIIVIDYEKLSNFGGEGYVSLYSRTK